MQTGFLGTFFCCLAGHEELAVEHRGFERKFYSTNLLATRSVQIKRYLAFVDDFSVNRSPFPCSSERVALYATWLARSLSYRSILNYLSGLNYFLKQNGSAGIAYEDYIVAATLKGIKRGKGMSLDGLPLCCQRGCLGYLCGRYGLAAAMLLS